MERAEVYEIIDTERDYQQIKWPDNYHEVGAYLTMLRTYLNEAEDNWWTRNSGDDIPVLNSIRKIAGISVACMEEHGAPRREINPPTTDGL